MIRTAQISSPRLTSSWSELLNRHFICMRKKPPVLTEVAQHCVRLQSMKAGEPMFILYVHEMDRAVTFYRDTFNLEVIQHTPGWSMLRLGDSTIALHMIFPGSDETTCSSAGLNLLVEELDSAISEVLSAGGRHVVSREPDEFVPVRMCELKDTEGNGIELRQFVGTTD